ncbi:MAG: DUF4190 domain-containing protein [Phycisphaerales bacterium]|jgi:hypothetical protein
MMLGVMISSRKTSQLAILSLIFAISGILLLPLAIVGITLGILSLCKISKNKDHTKGAGYAIAGIVVSAFTIVLSCLVILWLTFNPIITHSRNPNGILKAGRLAPLPQSAADVKAAGWSSIFAGEDYLMFSASPADIDKFIADSPSISKSIPEVYTPQHKHLPSPENISDFNDFEIEEHIKHDYYYRHEDTPDWYEPTINIGRKYEIPGDPNKNGHNWGSVIINDESHCVYIEVIWS